MNSLIQKRVLLILKILLLGCSLHSLFLSPVWAKEKCTPEIIKVNIKKFQDSDDLVKEIISIVKKDENNSNTVKNIKVSIKKFKDLNGLEREQAFNLVVECDSVSVKVLRDALQEKNTSVRFREMVTFALAKIGKKAGEATPNLRETLKNDPSPIVRSNAAFALGEIGYKAKKAVPELIEALGDKNITVRHNAIYALGVIGDKAAIFPLIKNFTNNFNNVNDHNRTVVALGLIGFKYITPSAGASLLIHIIFWLVLIFIYPKSTTVQAFVFWNPKVRKIMGLWYVDSALTFIPFLRSKLFEPFYEPLRSEAQLKDFNSEAYFTNLYVEHKGKNEKKLLQEAIPQIQGRIILLGESGLGKSMFLRYLVKSSLRIVVYLPARRCEQGVVKAIQEKMHGSAKDPNFLEKLIYSGAIDICIDGLDEVSPKVRDEITKFLASYFKGNIIIATQPIDGEETEQSSADTYILQPLDKENIKQFLISREKTLSENAIVSGSYYKQSCQEYLKAVLDQQQSPEEQAVLANPMDLTLVSEMLAQGKKNINLLDLQQEQYDIMANKYQEKYTSTSRDSTIKFPLKDVADNAYDMRFKDSGISIETGLKEEKKKESQTVSDLQKAFKLMEEFKMVVSRQFLDTESRNRKEYYFRHNKIQDFFIMQKFLSYQEQFLLESNKKNFLPQWSHKNNIQANNILTKHIREPKFYGVYLMLATKLSEEATKNLNKLLIKDAIDTKDHTLSDAFTKILISRDCL